MNLRRGIRASALLCAALLYAGSAAAIDATPPLPDPVLQQRYSALTH